MANTYSEFPNSNLVDAKIRDAVTGKADKATTYTKEEVDAKVAEATPSDYDSVKVQVTQNATDIDAIKGKIPSQAHEQNQLADKAFVNSSISTNTANYISDNGSPFASLASLQAYAGTITHNDYAFVVGTDSDGNTTYTRYKYNANSTPPAWAEEYVLNNSSFTAAQWAAISSGMTSGLVAKLGALPTADELAAALLAKYEKPSTGIPKTDLSDGVQASLDKADTALQTAPVTKVNNKTGDVTLTLNDVCPDAENWLGVAGTTAAGKSIKVLAKTVDGVIEGGVTVTASSSNNNNTTKFRYDGVTATRNGVATDYLFDNSQSGIARRSDIAVKSVKLNGTALTPDANGAVDVQALGNSGIQTLDGMLVQRGSGPNGITKQISFYNIDSDGMQWAICFNGSSPDIQLLLPTTDGTLALVSQIYAAVQQIAPDFTAKTYVLNELCTYNGVVYRCKSAYTATARSTKPSGDTTHWEAKKVSELFLGNSGVQTLDGMLVQNGFGPNGITKQIFFYNIDSDGMQWAINFNGLYPDVQLLLPTTDGTLALTSDIPSVSGLAPLASPAFTGTPTAPTPTAGDNSTKVATTAFVKTAVDGVPLRYDMPSSVALVADNDEATLVCADRAVTNATIASGFSTLNLTFPTAVSGKVRDFYLRITVAAGESAPALSIPQGITIENPDGAVPEIADGETSAASTTLVWFSETAPNVFTAKAETVKAVA